MTTVENVSAAVPATDAELVDGAPNSSFTTGIIGLIVVGLGLVSAAITFVVLSGLTPIRPTQPVFYTVIAVNGVTVFALLVVISRGVWQIIQARRRGQAGSRLHVQIVGLFSIIAAMPNLLA